MIFKKMTLLEFEESLFEDDDFLLDFTLSDIELNMNFDFGYRHAINKNYIYIPYLGVNIHYALAESFDKEKLEFVNDYDFYVFVNSVTNEHLYSENSSLMVCIYNYIKSLTNITLTMDEIENLECELVISEVE